MINALGQGRLVHAGRIASSTGANIKYLHNMHSLQACTERVWCLLGWLHLGCMPGLLCSLFQTTALCPPRSEKLNY